MISKEQAHAAALALTYAQRKQRQRRDARLIWYPELDPVPMRRRKAVLKAAKQRAWRRWPVIAVVCACAATLVAWAITRELGFDASSDIGGALTLVVVVGLVLHRWCTRRELRRLQRDC